MMDGKQIRNKLIGTDDERAVSPVIGVILMVAITVILAAVIAAFVMDMGQNQEPPVQAAVDAEVTNSDGQVQITITDAGNAESFEVRGSNSMFTSNADGSNYHKLSSSSTGTVITLNAGAAGDSGSPVLAEDQSGELSVVGINGDQETTVATFSVDWPSDVNP